MNRKQQLVTIFAAFIVITIAMMVFAFTSMNQPAQQVFPFPPHQQDVNVLDMQLYYVTRTVFNTINIVLLVTLLITYLSIYLKTRSQFTIGLLLFASVFLIKDIAASPLLSGVFGSGLFGLGPFVLWFVLLPDLFELIALSVLVYLSVR
jgi:hypothetical protein